MTEEQKLTLRGGILIQLNAAYPRTLNPESLRINLKLVNDFKTISPEKLDEQLRYLEKKDRVERVTKDGGLRHYLITDSGRSWLDEEELI